MPKRSDKKTGSDKTWEIIISGLITGVGIAIILLVIISIGISKGKIPENMVKQLSMCAVLIGAICGSFSGAKIRRSHGLVTGLLIGAAIVLIRSIILLCAGGSDLFGGYSFGLLICLLCGGVLGGLVGANRKVKRRR